MKEAKYQTLPQHNEDVLSLAPKKRTSIWSILLVTLLFISTGINVFTFFSTPKRGGELFSKDYSGQQETIHIHIPHENRTLRDEFWDESRLNPYEGMIAVDDDYVREHNLPEAQRWPWDRSKSMYYMNAWHSLHCVHMIRRGLISLDEGLPLPKGLNMGHLTHCLHVLRQDVECFADDLPLYTGAFNAEAGHYTTAPGHGQLRQCRSWDKVREFAHKHSACFDAEKAGIAVPEINKYKFCPDGSKPWLDRKNQ